MKIRLKTRISGFSAKNRICCGFAGILPTGIAEGNPKTGFALTLKGSSLQGSPQAILKTGFAMALQGSSLQGSPQAIPLSINTELSGI